MKRENKGEQERCEQVSLEENEKMLPSTLPFVNHASLPLPRSTRVAGERGEIMGEKEREAGVLTLGCNEVLCVFLSFIYSLSAFKKWNYEGNEYVHKQAQFWVGSVPSVPPENKNIYFARDCIVKVLIK